MKKCNVVIARLIFDQIMNNENSQAQAESHAGGNDKLGINFAWPNKDTTWTTVSRPVQCNLHNKDTTGTIVSLSCTV